ncbi:hypothetical protein L6164_035878 [Bauhinia variegata]|uniref:Uncharacterized protein n=1 Tax=Bauhinia variegata TaxID=167791 RepID=A0ACB9KFF8_BAUVA|nr:hypothetical protein L6164_035878 [Bauhinia variegata]
MESHLKSLFGKCKEQFASGPGLGPGSQACLMKVDGIDPEFIKSIYKAAAALYRSEPWKRLRPGHFFGVKVGKDRDWAGKKMPFPCAQFIGGDGGDIAFYMFRSENDAKKMTGRRETIRVPNVELLRVTYDEESLMFLPNREMIKNLSLEQSGSHRFPVIDVGRCMPSGELRFRNPRVEELRFVYAFMKAISMVHPLLQIDQESGPIHPAMVGFEPFIETVDVQWPPEVIKGGSDIVAVTISHPPGRAYIEKAGSSDSIRACAFCDKDVHADHSLCCVWCTALVYCSSICQKQHWKDTHKSMCRHYQAVMEKEDELAIKKFLFPCSAEQPCKWLESLGIHQKGMWRRKCKCSSVCPFGLLPPVEGGLKELWGGLDDIEYPHDTPFNNNNQTVSSPFLLSGWSEYYNLRSLSIASPVADILSYPLTVYYILTTLNISSKNLILEGKVVIVHYLGPEGELDWIPSFVELGHLLNGFGNVQIVMVGPKVPISLSGATSEVGTRVKVNLVNGIYQEEASYLPSPHVIIALNCGLKSYYSWGGALDLIKSMGVPAFFTEQSEIALLTARQVLHNAELLITGHATPNPFRSPVKNLGSSCNLPSYSNAFLFAVNSPA